MFVPMTPLQKSRIDYQIVRPKILEKEALFKGQEKTSAIGDAADIQEQFPKTFGRPILHLIEGTPPDLKKSLKVGVVFSGGQAPGGHNVIAGALDALKEFHPECRLFGFLGGPSGLVEGSVIELCESRIQKYRNQGGFDLIGSGRTKIETEEQLKKSIQTLEALHFDGVIIIGGDDSNTNAAILAEFALNQGCGAKIIGVPKTIDGDLKNDWVATSFGFHTASLVYAELIGNLARDALSAKKYTHFIKLMGRSASHIALECALLTQPNLTLIGEEIFEKNLTLKEIVSSIADLVEKRSLLGKNYGVIVIPEGIVEFIPEMGQLLSEISSLASQKQEEQTLPLDVKKTFDSLPKEVREQLLLERDPHGNVQVSHIQVEVLLSALVKEELKTRVDFKGAFHPIHHFFGYEGRCAFPTNFDATYSYSLGQVAARLIREGHTGYMSVITNLWKPFSSWGACALPLTSLMHLETRKGKKKAVIRKTLVDLKGAPYQYFEKNREKWREEDCFLFPGPIQFQGDPSLVDACPKSIVP